MKVVSLTEVRNGIQEFLEIWRDRGEYLGTLLTGSFASDTADEGSDIDLRILYKKEAAIREMGECWIAGKCISFFATSYDEFLEIFKEELGTISRFEIRRFVLGKILEDKTGQVALLKKQAEEMVDILLEPMLPVDVLSQKLELSRKYKVFLEMPSHDVFYTMGYYNVLQEILNVYARFTQADIPAYIKKYSRYFGQATYRAANKFKTFPDAKFVNLYLEAAQMPATQKLKVLYQYTIDAMEGLVETNFLARFHANQQQANLYLFE